MPFKNSDRVSGGLAHVLVEHATQAIQTQHRSSLRGSDRFGIPRDALAQAFLSTPTRLPAN